MNYISGWHLVKMLRVGLISSNRANYLLSRCFRNERFSNLKYFSVGLQQSLRDSPTHIHRFSVPSEYCVLKFRIRKESHFSSSPFATIFNNTHTYRLLSQLPSHPGTAYIYVRHLVPRIIVSFYQHVSAHCPAVMVFILRQSSHCALRLNGTHLPPVGVGENGTRIEICWQRSNILNNTQFPFTLDSECLRAMRVI